MNCQEALSLLYDVIDKEASEIDTRQVEEHLRNCRDCSGVYRLERSVNELLQEKLKSQQSTPRLDSLKAKLLNELDQIDCADQPEESPKKKPVETAAQPALRLGRALAIAASVIVVIGAAWLGNSILTDHAAFLPLEEAHWAAQDNLDLYRNQVVTSLTRLDTRQSLAYDVAEDINSFTLVGGQSETVDDVPLTHFVYHNENRVVSVFVIDAAMVTLPADLLETLVTRHGIQFYDHNCRGCRLVYHQVGNALVVTATTHRDIELLDFVPDRTPV